MFKNDDDRCQLLSGWQYSLVYYVNDSGKIAVSRDVMYVPGIYWTPTGGNFYLAVTSSYNIADRCDNTNGYNFHNIFSKSIPSYFTRVEEYLIIN